MGEIISFGEQLRRLRKTLDLTQEMLAKRVGCAVSTVVKFENDQRRPSHAMAARLAEVLEIPAGELEKFLRAARRQRGRDFESSPNAPLIAAAPVIPQASTPLIGREVEVAAIQQLLARPECRLLTILGPGGIGKTRLAIHTATQMLLHYPAGVIFVSLEPITSGALLPAAIAEAANFTFHSAESLSGQVINFFRSKQSLLVLDCIEHLLKDVEVIELLHSLVENCPQLTLLITSRERVNLKHEWALEVQGLTYPAATLHEAADPHSPLSFQEYPSIALFLIHAQRIRPGFSPTAADWQSIGRICRAVEGLPLGIELASAWLSSLSCSEIAEEIERGIDFLSLSARDVPERHRSIRAVFDHSWKLLSPQEQRVLSRLSTFRGGFTRGAAGQVADADLNGLSALVVKSLLRRSTQGRYDLHDLIRQYSANHLKPEEAASACRQHADYFLQLLQARLEALKSRQQKEILEHLKRDIDNIRAAWNFAVEHGEMNLIGNTAWAIWYFFDLQNLYREYIEMLLKAEKAVEQQRTSSEGASIDLELVLSRLRTWRAFAAIRVGGINEALPLLDGCIDYLRHSNDQPALCDALWVAGLLRWLSGEFAPAAAALRESLAIVDSLALQWQKSLALTIYGAVLHELGDYHQAYHFLKQALALSQELGIPRHTTFAIGLFLRTTQALGYPEDVEKIMRKHLQLATEMDDRSAMAFALENLALVAQAQANLEEARRSFQTATQLYITLGDFWSASRALVSSANFERAQHQSAAARQLYAQAAQTALDAQSYPNALDALLGLAELSAQETAFETACILACHALHHPASTQATKAQAARLKAEVESQLDPRQADEASSRGRELTLEAALKIALN